MKCVICQGENIVTKKIKEPINKGNDIIHVILKIPVCQNCGEKYYPRATIQMLEKLEVQVQNSELHLKEVGKVLEYVA